MSKKTETIEIRLSPELKADLAAKSGEAGLSMSQYVRNLVETGPPEGTSGKGPIMANRTLRTSLLAAIPVAAAAFVYSFAATAPVHATAEARITFAELDRNGDGAITEAEFTRMMTEEVESFPLPAACTGTEIEAEMSTPVADRVKEEMSYLDSNGDGAVVYEELAAVLTRERAEEFLDTDANEDGFVTLDELRTVFADDTEAEPPTEEEKALDACFAALDAEEVEDLDNTNLEADLRLYMAEFDTNRDNKVSLLEYIEN